MLGKQGHLVDDEAIKVQGVAQQGGQLAPRSCQGAAHHLGLPQHALPGLPLGFDSLLLPLLGLCSAAQMLSPLVLASKA